MIRPRYIDLDGLTAQDLLSLGARWWDSESRLMLLPAPFLERLAPGTVLTTIMGRQVTVGVDAIDRDTRYGMLACGVYK